jgi:uncharacterized protein YegP (UPF0339 family)
MAIGAERRFEVYQDVGGSWRWRLVAVENGRIVAVSGESFDSKQNAERAVETESSYYQTGTYVVVTRGV